MTTRGDDILDDLFHGCALIAYIDQAIEEQGPPDCERTRRRACRYYEEALAEKNGRGEAPEQGQHTARRSASR
jgi:hypothetical protein